MKVLICLLVCFAFSMAHAAETTNINPTGIYSDIYFNKEGGDLLGTEIFLLHSGDGYYVLFQSAQGGLSIPVLVSASLIKNKLSFELPKNRNGYGGLFSGIIYHNRIEGRLSNGQLSPSGQEIFILKKGKSYWQ